MTFGQDNSASGPDDLAARFGPVEFDSEHVRAVERILAEFAVTNSALIGEGVDALRASWQAASMDLAPSAVARCILIAHDLGGFGGTLGYPIVTNLCRSLNRYLRLDPAVLPAARDVISIHISALEVVAARRITGDGGNTGREIAAELARAIKKFDGMRQPSMAEPPDSATPG
jgi:hypothetical protein